MDKNTISFDAANITTMNRPATSESNRKRKSLPSPSVEEKDFSPNLSQQVLVFIPPTVALSQLDRGSRLELSRDQLTVSSTGGGYKMIRATHGVHNGTYFWECEVMPSTAPNSHIRIGWATRFGELQAPVGYDKCSYGYCDVKGGSSHARIMTDYGEPFQEGDIIGCFLSLDNTKPERNHMRFFKNGVDQTDAYSGKEIRSGVYFPAVSLYGRASARVNFGPSFIIPISHEEYGANACSELQPMNPSDRKEHEQRIADIRASRERMARLTSTEGLSCTAPVESGDHEYPTINLLHQAQ